MNPIVQFILDNMMDEIPVRVHANADRMSIELLFAGGHRPNAIGKIEAENRNQFMDWWGETGPWWREQMRTEFPGIIDPPAPPAAGQTQ